MSKWHILASFIRGGAAPVSIPLRVLRAAVTAGAKAGVEELAKASSELGDGTQTPKMIGHSYPYQPRVGGAAAIASLLFSGFMAGTYGGADAQKYAQQAFNALGALVAPAPEKNSTPTPPPVPAAKP